MIAHGKLIAFDEPANLEKSLLAPGEILITAEASEEEIRTILSGVEHLTEMVLQLADDNYTTLQIQTDEKNIYQVSRSIFEAFAHAEIPLLEMSLKKASLEDVFLELAEGEQKTPSETVDGEMTDEEVTEA